MVRYPFRLAALLGFCAFVSAQAFAIDPFTIDKTLSVGPPSQLNFNVTLNIDYSGVSGSDSDNANSSITGTVDATFFADASTGGLTITGFELTGGQLNASNISLDFAIKETIIVPITVATIDVTGSNLGGVAQTAGPVTLATPAYAGSPGQFSASSVGVTIDQGQLSYTVDPLVGDTSMGTVSIASSPFEGVNQAGSPGTITVTPGAIDMQANTTMYSLTWNLPVQFTTDEPLPLQRIVNGEVVDDYGTADVAVAGSITASVADITVDFIPWNGLVGDVNQNGSVGTDDIDAFVDGWRSTNDTPGKLAYMLGDMNFDGITNLHDAFILHEALKGQNLSFQVAGLVSNVPEPSTILLAVLGCGILLAARRR